MTKLDISMGIKRANVPARNNWMKQVGWLGYSGQVYSIQDPPSVEQEKGFSPLYVEDGD